MLSPQFASDERLRLQFERLHLRVGLPPLVERLDLAQDIGHVVSTRRVKAKAHDVYPIIPEALVAKGAKDSALH
jgi:hypothetical protein